MRRCSSRHASTPHVVELSRENADARCDASTIDLQLGFARTAGSNPTSQAREIGADADELGLAIAQLRKLNLHPPFAAARMLGEDIQNKHCAIDDRNRDDLLKVLTLTRAQIVKYEQQARIERFDALGNFTCFAGADEERRIDRRTLLHDPFEDARAGGGRKCFEFDQFGFERASRIVEVDGDDYRASGVKR